MKNVFLWILDNQIIKFWKLDANYLKLKSLKWAFLIPLIANNHLKRNIACSKSFYKELIENKGYSSRFRDKTINYWNSKI